MSPSAVLWIGIPATSCLLYGLLFYIGGRGTRHETFWFSAFLFIATVWSLTSMLLHAAPSFLNLLGLNRLVVFANFALPLTILGFTLQFLSLRRQRAWMQAAIVAYLIIAILNLLGVIVTDVQVNHGLISFEFGWGVYVGGIFWAFCIYSSAFFLLRELRGSRDRMFRNRVRYILVVLLLLLIGYTLNATRLKAYPVDLLLAAIAASLISLSISRYQVLEVQRTLCRLAALGLVLALYIAALAGAIYLLGSFGREILVPISIATACVTAVILYSYPPVRRAINAAVERLFLPELYDVQTLIYAISRAGNRLTPPGQLGASLLREFGRALQFEVGALLLKQEADAPYGTVAVQGLPSEAMQVAFQADSPLIKELTEHNMAMHVDRLLELPRLQALWAEEWQSLHLLQTEILLPVLAEAELIGFFTFGPRRGGEPYTRQELQRTLPALANQVSLALANSRLYAREHTRGDQLAHANEDLRQLDRMKDELVQNVSHELRTPLTIIQGYAELLVDSAFTSPDDTQMAAQAVLRQTQHLNHLVNRLLMFQRLNRADVVLLPLAVAPWLAELAGLWRTILTEGQFQFCVEVRDDLGQVRANEDYLRQVVSNLLDNARKFSPPGATVFLRSWRKDGQVCVAVADQGIGVPPDKLPLLFERFYQVDGSSSRRFGGMGLGLALCQEIVARHNGRIWAESLGEGHGLTVTFSLPAVAS